MYILAENHALTVENLFLNYGRLQKKKKVTIYYIDTEKPEKKETTKIREKYNIDYVPTLLSLEMSRVEKFNAEAESLDNFIE